MRLPDVAMPAASVYVLSTPVVVHSTERCELGEDLDEEHRRAVHQHQVARAAHARAEGLRQASTVPIDTGVPTGSPVAQPPA